MVKRNRIQHHCDLPKRSDSYLLEFKANANIFQKFCRCLKQQTVVNKRNILTKTIFRSHYALRAEKRRHMQMKVWYVIHPCSMFSLYFEFIMSFVWLTLFVFEPYQKIFNYYNYDLPVDILLALDIMLLIQIVVNFFLGYCVTKTKEIVLEPSKIRKRYLKTYFIFDILSAIQLDYILHKTINPNDTVLLLVSLINYLKFVRIYTMFNYFSHIFEWIGLTYVAMELICILLFVLLFIHFWTCVTYLLPQIVYNQQLPNTTWLAKTGLQFNNSYYTPIQIYRICFINAMTHFYNMQAGQAIDEPIEELLFSLITITGSIIYIYLYVRFLKLLNSTGSSEIKYEKLILKLKQYMQQINLPQDFRARLLSYFEYRFNQHYFHESAIISTLSDHLSQQLFMYTFQPIVSKISVFKFFTNDEVLEIAQCLTHEVYLPNDIIFDVGEEAVSMYFIVYGRVTFILPDIGLFMVGEDGRFFGEVPLIIPEMNATRVVRAVATEITEVLKLGKKDFIRLLGKRSEVVNVALDKYSKLIKTLTSKEDIVVSNLRSGKILEQFNLRKLHHK